MYLITGCAGFIGYHMTNYLTRRNNKVIGVDSLNRYYSKDYKYERLKILKKNKRFKFYKIDLSNEKEIKNLLTEKKIKYVIHLAAQPGVIYSYKNPDSYYKNNVKATQNLVDLFNNKTIKNFIFVSSSSVYGDQKKYPIKENFKLIPKNYYAKTKITCEKIVTKGFAKNNIPFKIVRPFTVYGPYGRPDMLVLKYLTYSKSNKILKIFNFGKHLRDFTYVDDVVKIIYILSKKNNGNKIYNICASKPIQIIQFLNIFKKLNKFCPNIKYFKKRKGEMNITYGSNFRVKKDINYKNFVSIEAGLAKTISWYKLFKFKKILKT